jgi:hypothetical protein
MTGSAAIESRQRTIVYPALPLAVYREIAAHLEQITGVRVTLQPRRFDRFDYCQSQIESLVIHYTAEFEDNDSALVTAILDYYAARHGSYQLS